MPLSVSSLALALVLTLTPLVPAHASHGRHPRSFASPSGEYLLHVLPTAPNGVGPCTLSLTRLGRTCWRIDAPFTFIEAVVDNDGTSAGFAWPRGKPLQGMCGMGGGLNQHLTALFGIVTSTGRVHVLREWEGYAPELRVLRAFGSPSMLFGSGGSWWALPWPIEEDETVLELFPSSPPVDADFRRDFSYPIDECGVDGTPLRLLIWDWKAMLVNARREPVWFRDFGEPVAGSSWGPGIFAVGSGELAATFQVERTDPWRVDELTRRELLVELAELEPVVVELHPTSTVDLRLEDGTRFGSTERGRFHTVVDQTGRVAVLERSPEHLRVFGPDGQLVIDIELEQVLGHVRLERTAPLAVADGIWHLYLDQSWGGTRRAYIALDGRIELEDSPVSQRFEAVVPKSGARWVMERHDLYRIDAQGRQETPAMQRPDGRWFGHDVAVSAAPDGSAAVLERGELHVYSADGTPRASFTVPGRGARSLAFDGWRAAVVTSDALFVLDVVSGRSHLIPLAYTSSPGLAFSAATEELLLASPREGTLRRFAIP